MFGRSLFEILLGVPITLIALTGHELAHAWVSTKLGDPTPRLEGRLSLNPLAHLDIMGTILMILTGFGWAKPVGVNPMYYKNRKGGMALVAAAGPIANFIMAFVTMLILGIFIVINNVYGVFGASIQTISLICQTFALRNVAFMVFNLIPIPPLDGSKILGMFLPDKIYYKVLQYERYAIIIIMLLSFSGALDKILFFGYNNIYLFIINIVNFLINLGVKVLTMF